MEEFADKPAASMEEFDPPLPPVLTLWQHNCWRGVSRTLRAYDIACSLIGCWTKLPPATVRLPSRGMTGRTRPVLLLFAPASRQWSCPKFSPSWETSIVLVSITPPPAPTSSVFGCCSHELYQVCTEIIVHVRRAFMCVFHVKPFFLPVDIQHDQYSSILDR